ncbi:MAG: hypothetical protein ACI9XC_002635 [Gammaproteobacteria bacterium]|jgi:hypothetical protein
MSGNKKTLELIFSLFIGLVVISALISSLTYDFVSARTPIVILIPLLLLSALNIKRAWSKASGEIDIKADMANVFQFKNKEFNGVAGFFGWMVFLLGLIFITGHYVGIAVFMFFLIYLVSEEKLSLAIIVSIVISAIIYMLFEHLFNIELYRGLIFRIWAGYGI